VVLSISGLCFAREGLHNIYKEFLVKMRSVEMFIVCREEYSASNALEFIALRGSPGMKFTSFDIRSLLRPDGEKSESQNTLLPVWRDEYNARGGRMEVEDASMLWGNDSQRNMRDLLLYCKDGES
jgi:hypothetical protein